MGNAAEALADNRSWIARQPILDRHGETFGYELLYRGSRENKAVVHDATRASVLAHGAEEVAAVHAREGPVEERQVEGLLATRLQRFSPNRMHGLIVCISCKISWSGGCTAEGKIVRITGGHGPVSSHATQTFRQELADLLRDPAVGPSAACL